MPAMTTDSARFEPAGEPTRLRANQFAGWLHYPVTAVSPGGGGIARR